MRKVEVVAFSEEWEKKFDEEAILLQKVFGVEIQMIHHIGSTSVNGLSAKPIIDIMPIVRDINKIDAFNNVMIAIGYEPKGENGLPGRRYFQKGGDNRTHHVHMYEMGNPEIERHLAFRDFLKAHPSSARKYGDLKEALSKQFPYCMEAYINGKEELAKEIEQQAIHWVKKLGGRNFHRAFGVYGICVQDGKLLVINKSGGPYINRFDLPGGSLEDKESLVNAMRREFLEETGLEIEIIKSIGTTDFMISTDWRVLTDVHHIAVYYLVKQKGGVIGVPNQFEGQDSLGAEWILEEEVSVENASPLVLKAFEWLRTNDLGLDINYYDWKVKLDS